MAGAHERKPFDFKSKTVAQIVNKKQVGSALYSRLVKILIAAVVAAMLVSSFFVAGYFVRIKSHHKILEQTEQIFNEGGGWLNGINLLKEYNEDIEAWIYVPNSKINCAVAKGENDSYYLKHNLLKEKSSYGSIFMSASDDLYNGDKNIVIYGNEMRDGTLFGTLSNYRNLKFYKQNPIITLTDSTEERRYAVFAVMLLDSKNSEGYDVGKGSFVNEREFSEWKEETARRSILKTSTEIIPHDELLTLITTAEDFDGARLAVVAVRTQEGAQIDTSKAVINGEVKYPKAWQKSKKINDNK